MTLKNIVIKMKKEKQLKRNEKIWFAYLSGIYVCWCFTRIRGFDSNRSFFLWKFYRRSRTHFRIRWSTSTFLVVLCLQFQFLFLFSLLAQHLQNISFISLSYSFLFETSRSDDAGAISPLGNFSGHFQSSREYCIIHYRLKRFLKLILRSWQILPLFSYLSLPKYIFLPFFCEIKIMLMIKPHVKIKWAVGQWEKKTFKQYRSKKNNDIIYYDFPLNENIKKNWQNDEQSLKHFIHSIYFSKIL